MIISMNLTLFIKNKKEIEALMMCHQNGVRKG